MTHVVSPDTGICAVKAQQTEGKLFLKARVCGGPGVLSGTRWEEGRVSWERTRGGKTRGVGRDLVSGTTPCALQTRGTIPRERRPSAPPPSRRAQLSLRRERKGVIKFEREVPPPSRNPIGRGRPHPRQDGGGLAAGAGPRRRPGANGGRAPGGRWAGAARAPPPPPPSSPRGRNPQTSRFARGRWSGTARTRP